MPEPLAIYTGIDVAIRALSQIVKALKEPGSRKNTEQLRAEMARALQEVGASLERLDQRLRVLEEAERRRQNRFFARVWRAIRGG